MKTFFKKSKRYVGLAFASLLVFSALFASAPTATYAQGTPPATPDAPCRGSTAPAGTNCDTIPRGCPGTTLPGPVAPGATLNCPYNPSDNVWKCPTTACILPSGQVGQNQPGIGTNPPPTPPPADPNANDPELDCNTTETVLDWVICPVVKIVGSAINTLDAAIVKLLEVNPETVDEGNADSGAKYYQAWQSFRNIALGILVVGAIIMIIGQALGFELLDAYTVKKILPRLIVAILGISLSWEIMAWFVTFTNDLGFGIRSMIYYPFRGLGTTITGGGEGVILTLLTSAGILALGIFGLLTMAGTVLLGLILAFLVLTLRQIIIVTLILLAPIAIACYILPNTQSIWKLWYESFTKALMMFPIIMAFLAVGRVFAQVASGDSDQFNTIDEFIALIAYVLPYFLIPLTFRFAGGALRTVGGFVNDKGRGGFDRLKKARQENTADRFSRMKNGHLFKSNNRVATAFNTTTETAANLKHAGVAGVLNPRKGKYRVQSAMMRHGMDEVAEFSEKNSQFNAIKGNDDFLEAGIHGKGSDKKTYEYLRNKGYDDDTAQRATAAIREARREVSGEVFDTAAAMALPATGTAFKGGAGEMQAMINEVAGNDRVKAARMLAGMRSTASQARRPDLAGSGFSDQLMNMEEQHKEELRIQNDVNLTDDQKSVAIQQVRTNATRFQQSKTLDGQYAGAIINARKRSVEALAPIMREQIETALADAKKTGDTHKLDRELAALAGRYDAMQSAAPENAKVMADMVMGGAVRHYVTVKDASGNERQQEQFVTIRHLMEEARSRPAGAHGEQSFLDMRREYSNAMHAKLAAEAVPQGGVGQPTGGQPGGQQGGGHQ